VKTQPTNNFMNQTQYIKYVQCFNERATKRGDWFNFTFHIRLL